MTIQSAKRVSLGAVMLERAAVILKMKALGLDLCWLKEFGLPELDEACERMEEELPGERPAGKSIQRELIQNPAFARYLARLLPLLPKDAPTEPPKPVYPAGRYGQPAPKVVPSRRGELIHRLNGFVEACQGNGKDPAGYNLQDVVGILDMDGLDNAGRLVYLENFAPMALTHEQKGIAINSLRQCVEVPIALTREQRDQLLEPYASVSSLFAKAAFGDVWELLERCPVLRKILRLLYERNVLENLDLTEYATFSQAPEKYLRGLTDLTERFSPNAAARFLNHWQRDGCPLHALSQMVRRIGQHPDMDWENALQSYSGYVNLISGVKFRNLNLAGVPQHLEDILLYAMTHKKTRFVRLVDENPEAFLLLPRYSFLLQEPLYREHLNLNELTAKDLADCAWMRRPKLEAEHLDPGRRYTFPELRALYGVQKQYVDFYHALESDSQDYRLRVFREVCKQDALDGIAGDSMQILANLLSNKPLSIWKQERFGHIDGLSAADTARLLIHLDGVQRLLPDMRGRNDVMLVLRNLDSLERFATLDELKEHLTEVDADWRKLAQAMGLTADFQEQYREGIVAFLSQGGAAIALEYLPCLDESHKEAFLRVVKAELMGRLREVKYHDGDLHRELDMDIPSRVANRWPENLTVSDGSIEANEHDGFFDAMLLGQRPQRTCLSYSDGMYRRCLLSAFDSNKKVLYARQDGRVVGRAFLRLTKCRKTSAESSGLSFVDLEAGEPYRPEQAKDAEQIALFLERPYISGVGPEARAQVLCRLIDLAQRKAEELGVLLVLSYDYADVKPQGFTRTRLHLYISRSKGGAQYLDSLDGEATVTKEGSYSANTFLVKN